MVPLLTFLLALVAFIIAILNGRGKGSGLPLWVAVALLALALMIPWVLNMAIR